MRETGAPPRAIAFARFLGFSGYLAKLTRVGPIDIGIVDYPFRANDNEVPVLLNGRPPLIDVWSEGRKLDLARNPLYVALVRENPGAQFGNDPPQLSGIQRRANGLSFIYLFEVKSCHACGPIGFVQVALSFDARGNYLNAQSDGIDQAK